MNDPVSIADPATQATLPARPKTSVRQAILAGLLGMLALFGGLGGWMAFVDISGAIVANGAVAVHGRPKVIQHLDGGIVAEISVTDGDLVKRGDLLVQLDETMLKANEAIHVRRLEEALAERSRLEAERDGKQEIAWPQDFAKSLGVSPSAEIKASQSRLLLVRRESRHGQRARLEEKIAQYDNQIIGVKGLQSAKQQQIALIDRELTGLRQLHEQGNTTLNRLLALERQRAELSGQLAEHGSELSRIQNAISEARINILQLEREFLETVLAELRKRDQEINEVVQQLTATRAQLSRVEVRAPVSGRVHQMSIFTIGGVVSPGATILQLVPQNEAIEVEVQVATQFIDEVYVGQPARIRFTAFNQHSTPELVATIATISPSSVVDEKSGGAYYRIWVNLAEGELSRLGNLRLLPGMPAEVFIKTRDRTALNYLVKPLTDQISRAFREE